MTYVDTISIYTDIIGLLISFGNFVITLIILLSKNKKQKE